jgi:uncharacterized protein involved in cysteine biosynthesis
MAFVQAAAQVDAVIGHRFFHFVAEEVEPRVCGVPGVTGFHQ